MHVSGIASSSISDGQFIFQWEEGQGLSGAWRARPESISLLLANVLPPERVPLRAHEEKDHQETALADEAHSEKGQAGEQATRKR